MAIGILSSGLVGQVSIPAKVLGIASAGTRSEIAWESAKALMIGANGQVVEGPPIVYAGASANMVVLGDGGMTLTIGGVQQQGGDLKLCFVVRRSAITSVQAGWTLVSAGDACNGGGFTQWLDIYATTAVSSGGTYPATFKQASAGRMLGLMISIRDPNGSNVAVSGTAQNTSNADSTSTKAIAGMTPTVPGYAVSAVASLLAPNTSVTWAVDDPRWQIPINGVYAQRLLVAVRPVPDLSALAGNASISGLNGFEGGFSANTILLKPGS